MALDARVGWLATVTEPGGEYLEHHGAETTARYTREFEATVATVDRALRQAGVGSFREPGFAEVGPDPGGKNGVRLGFYSSAREWHLASLLAHIEVHRSVPASPEALDDAFLLAESRYPLVDPSAPGALAECSCLAHPYWAAYGFSSVYVPVDFAPVFALPEEENEVLYIASSLRLERACSLLLAACGRADPYSEESMMLAEGAFPEVAGLTRLDETPEWLEPTTELISRLQQIARRSIAIRSLITFS